MTEVHLPVAAAGMTMDAGVDPARTLLRHTVATLAYRAGKVLRDAPPTFGELRVGATTRTPAQIVAHMGDLFEWALSMARGPVTWHDTTPLPWSGEVERFFIALTAFDAYLAGPAALAAPAAQLFQGPVADALTHTGQLAMMRRMAGQPIRGESYARADIAVGRTGLDQAAPRVEFG